MLDIVLAGAMGLVLAVVLHRPPKEPPRPVIATVVDEPAPVAARGAKTRKKRR